MPDAPVIDLGSGMYFYGANMAFAVEGIRGAGGFPEQIGRKGSGTLLSGEELQVQDVLRMQGGLVRRLVHADRLRRNWMRSRMAWQSISEQMAEPSWFSHSWASEELRRLAATSPNVAAAAQLPFAPAGREALSEQLSAVLAGGHRSWNNCPKADALLHWSAARQRGRRSGPTWHRSLLWRLQYPTE
jgi:hypothetical protein